MAVTERSRVGVALDAIRDALAAYVDDAMTQTYGTDWNDLVAEEDAKRRKSGRQLPVAKGDLVVMLKALIHRQIEPWSSLRTYPRIRAYASEVLSLRNLHAHGDECRGEHARLVDTGTRMLGMMNLPVPAVLATPDREQLNLPAGVKVVAVSERPQAVFDRLDAELLGLGGAGEQLVTVLTRAIELSTALSQACEDELRMVDPDRPDWNAFQRRFTERAASTGAEVLELLSAVDEPAAGSPVATSHGLGVLVLATRCELLSPLLESAVKLYIASLKRQFVDLQAAEVNRIAEWIESSPSDGEVPPVADHEMEAIERRIEHAQILVTFGQSHEGRLRDLIRVAARLGDTNPLANTFVASASLGLAAASKGDGGWTGEALPYVREAIGRLRFEASMRPGSEYESMLVRALRLEGEICSDLERTDDALQAFARADEIVDRYPAADPALKS